jgi:hypothetical protein
MNVRHVMQRVPPHLFELVRLLRQELGCNGAAAELGIGNATVNSICALGLVQSRTIRKLFVAAARPEVLALREEFEARVATRKVNLIQETR